MPPGEIGGTVGSAVPLRTAETIVSAAVPDAAPAVGTAMTELYNPAQVDVMRRVGREIRRGGPE